MCSKIGKLLKWTCKPLIYPTSKTFSKHPPNLCDSTISSGLNIVTSRIITLVGNSDNRRRYNTATYENVRDAGKANNVWIIDVRDRRDISRTGAIKNAINIPLKELEAAFQFTPEYFFNRYGASKPYFDSSIIFSCRSGRLSKVAYELAESMGYKKYETCSKL